MNSFFFNWHGLDMRHFSHTRTRLIAAVTFICALLMLFISLLSLVPVVALTLVMMIMLPLGFLGIARSYRTTKAVLLASIGIIEAVALASTGALVILPVFLILDVILAWFLFKKEKL